MYIVTGGTGFIGSNIVNELAKKNCEIVVVDRLDHPFKKKYLSSLKLIKVIKPESLFKFVENNHKTISSIIHMGAISSTSETNLKLLLNNNLFYSEKLFNLCNQFSIKFIYASSAATYGGGENGFDDNITLLDAIKLKPTNYYGLSKHLFDLKVLEQLNGSNKKLSSKPIGLKFFNVYGPNELHKGSMMSPIPKFLKDIQTNKEVNLFKSHNKLFQNGMQSRDFIYVKDCVKIVMWFLKNKHHSGIFNVGSGKSKNFLELAQAIFDNQDLKSKIHFIPTPLSIRNSYQYMTKANISKLREIGYKDKMTNLKDGINNYINNYL